MLYQKYKMSAELSSSHFWLNNFSNNFSFDVDNTTDRNTTKVSTFLWMSLINLFFDIIVALLTIIGNVLVLLAYTKDPVVRSVQTNMFIASLAVSDLFAGVFGLPRAVAHFTESQQLLFFDSKLFCLFRLFCYNVPVGISIAHLLAVGITCGISIRLPLRYNELVTIRRVKAAIVLCWVWVAIGEIVVYIVPGAIIWKPGFQCRRRSVVHPTAYNYKNAVGLLILIIVIATYTYVFVTAWKQKNKVASEIGARDPSTSSIKRSLKIIKTMGYIIGLLLLSFAPFYILAAVARYLPTIWSGFLRDMFATLVYLNSGLNPIIYSARSSEYKRAIRKILKKEETVNSQTARST